MSGSRFPGVRARPVASGVGWSPLVFVGGASFAGGYQTLARRLRKKFGGFKIYQSLLQALPTNKK